MADIDRVVYESLRASGAADLDRLTRAVTGGLRRELRGWVYIDRGFSARNAEIRHALNNGVSARNLAQQHALSLSQIYRIANR